MQITNEFKTRKIELKQVDSELEHYPSYQVEVIIETENIRAIGHLSVSCYLNREGGIESEYSYDLNVEFLIDPTSLSTVRAEFLEMID